MELVAEGTELNKLAEAESLFAEGDKGELRLYLDRKVSEDILYEFESSLCNQGVILTEPIRQEAHIVFIKFKKATEPLTIIAATIIATGVSSVIGWQLEKEPLGIPWWGWAIGAVSLGVLLFTFRRK